MKVAISGAGVAGPSLAFWLLRAGHEITLIEKAPAFRTGGYLVDFWGLGYTVAERMGILPAVREAGYPVQEVRPVDGRGRKAGGFSADVFRRITGDRFTSLPRGDLAAIIYRTVAPSVETLFGTSITALEQHPRGVAVTLDSGSERAFGLVIGADGLHSRVRELVFGPEARFERPLGYRVAAFEVDGYRPRDELVYVGYNSPGRQIARFALRGDRTMFMFVFLTEHLRGTDPTDLAERKATIRRVFGNEGWECPEILEAMDGANEVYYDRVSQIRMDKWYDRRVMLIGDAAACVSLLAGEGTGLAMTEAYVLAGELAWAHDDWGIAFPEHERRLRAFLHAKQESARKFAGAFAPRTRFGVWFRNQATRLLAIPALANYLVGRDLRDELEIPEY